MSTPDLQTPAMTPAGPCAGWLHWLTPVHTARARRPTVDGMLFDAETARLGERSGAGPRSSAAARLWGCCCCCGGGGGGGLDEDEDEEYVL